MDYLVEIKNTPELKPLVAFLRTLKDVKVKKDEGKSAKKRVLTDEEMAFPMQKKPTKEELTEFLDRPQGKGANLETVRKRVLASLAASRKK